ncbi:hypothetical protein RB653_002534 [Dictyostelium firmibasis]|uniref:ABC transporter domain-containing protein n=1 Tax=Dictyostelium firmibasis TaxID=79012 RepID=A0AAN7YQ68_9MYCE
MRHQNKNYKRPSFFSQFLVILWFRTKLSIRDKKFFVLGILLPMIAIGSSVLLSEVLVFPPGSDYQRSNNNLQDNNIFVTPYNLNSQQNLLLDTMKLQYSLNYTYLDDDTDLPDYIQNKSLSSLNYGISFIGKNGLNIYYNSSIETIPTFVHSFFISLFKINGINLQLNETITVLSSEVTFDVFYLLMPMILQYGFVFFIPYFAILIVTDRDKGYKNHLILNSLRTSAYWLSNLAFDYIIFLFPTIIGWIILYSFKIDGIYSDNSGKSFLLFITFGLSAIPFGFVLQFIFDKEETANKWLYPFTSIVTSIPSALISVAFPTSTPLAVELLLSILPTFSFCNGLKALTYNNSSTVSYTILIQLLSGLIYLILIYFIDNLKKPKKNEIIFDEDSESIINNQTTVEDNDVLNEKEKIKRLIRDSDGNKSNFPKIVVDGIYKQFIQPKPTLEKPSLIEKCSGGAKVTKKNSIIKKAVDGIWFSVEKNEIFGLLGPNGSGKSTCLNVLTGILKADKGDGYLSGKSIDKDKDVFQSIGSCAQNDILFENLTIYEHLYLFSRLKSITTKTELEDEIDFYINKFSIQSFKNKKSSDLSGGTKRKLSVACCLIGDPQVVLLDEPSTSLDPISRNELHSLIDELKANKSIIMTTHSINEINQCCNRVAIMVDGKIRCIGTPNHLKHKYGSGYTIDIVPKNYLNNSFEIHNFMAQTFPSATRVERLGRFISYDLPNQNQESLATIFRILQSNKQRLEILDFSASSSSLEKVFLKFANLQEEINKQQPNNNSINNDVIN